MGYDALVVGSGIGGMESALKLGDMGYKVLLVEKGPSIGGKMILLSKVFPTLDCASCISTPKMAATAHHPNVTIFTDSEVAAVSRQADGSFRAKVHRKPRFVDPTRCTGCHLCELACTVSVPDEFNGDLVGRHAAYIPFPQAVPQKALIERAGTSPCTFNCPAGIKAHGYVSLVRSGEYDKAFELVLEATPLVGTLGRACYAPCEASCTRSSLEGQLPIRRVKRFIADHRYTSLALVQTRPEPNGKRVAIVGSGPTGLTAAWLLARKGYGVKIFESEPEAGGALRLAIPSYRLPVEVVEADVANLAAIGVEIATNSRVEDLGKLRSEGFDAVVVATGTPRAARLGVPGEETLDGVRGALGFLRAIKLGAAPDLAGKVVAVVGGGNVAVDTARSAKRLGATEVHLVCLEARADMPAHEWEVAEACAEGVQIHDRSGVAGFKGDSQVQAVRLRHCLSVFDEQGRFAPRYDDIASDEISCDAVLVAVGMAADTATFPALVPEGARAIAAEPGTLKTAVPGVFAAGDAVTGPTTIAKAVGQGRRAAYMVDRWLQGLGMTGSADPLPAVDQAEVLARQGSYSFRRPVTGDLRFAPAPSDFAELEPPLTEAEARAAAGTCLDCGVCSECHECVSACPADAIDFDMRASDVDVDVGTVVISTGYQLFPAELKPQYGYGRFKNVVTGTQMERLLAPTRPFNTVLRPGDGKVPERIAYVMCTGSRDETVGNPLCSKFCCMYSLKQNQLLMGALPLADVTVHYIDVRAAGKGYDEFYEQAKAMGTSFVKGRVAGITEKPNGDLVLRYEDIDNGGVLAEAEYDLVVLAVGVRPNSDAALFFGPGELALDRHRYIEEVDEDLNPGATSIPGVFTAGAVSGARDIPESVLHAGAAAAQAAAYLERVGLASHHKVLA
ncbi:MAG TPA: FAD-dependent oxidoreductase [Acidimicrobiales bacterium]|nr:FAD-dependent oxidoreductase [Acidimicrobiales bacterium]